MTDTVQSAPKELLPGTKYGVILRSQLKAPGEISKSRQTAAAVALVSISLIWIAVFLGTDQIKETRAWAATFFCTAAASIAWVCASSTINPLLLFKIGENRRTTLAGSLAVSLTIFSVVLGSWLVLHRICPAQVIVANRQIIDIELVSPKDFEDKHNVLPSTQHAEIPQRDLSRQGKPMPATPSQEKTKAPRSAPAPVTASTATTFGAHQARTMPIALKNQIDVNAGSFVIRQQPAPSPQVLKPARTPQEPMELSPPMLEEVAPPQLLEVTDSQNERVGEVSQSGGHSSGGLGSQTLLVSYLKELHRRIKRAWTPPSDGETLSAQILFRIRKNGQLASIKLIRSSGQSDSDESAMHAVVACSPFKSLPPEFSSDYLDLLYTFNYKVDQLSEVSGSQTH